MNYLTKVIVTLFAVLALTACEKETEADAPATNGTADSTEKIVTAEIPANLTAEAEREVTEENAEQVAADLEKELDAELN